MIYKILSLTQDITKEYLAEEILRKQNSNLHNEIQEKKADNEKKDQLLFDQSRHLQMAQLIQMIAHQWRQPLSLINTVMATLQIKRELNMLTDSMIETSFKKIEQTTKHLSDTIDDFRDYFKPGKINTQVKLYELFNKSIFFLKEEMEQHNIAYIVTDLTDYF